MCQCEDRPCCGHAAEERADARYAEERAWEFGWMSPEDEHNSWCHDCSSPANKCEC
jgi:hypothetical protein